VPKALSRPIFISLIVPGICEVPTIVWILASVSEPHIHLLAVDGLWAYEKAFKKVFYSRYKEHRVEFVRRAGIKARETNNIVGRLHETLKEE